MTGIRLSRQFQPRRVDAEKVPRVGIRYWHLETSALLSISYSY